MLTIRPRLVAYVRSIRTVGTADALAEAELKGCKTMKNTMECDRDRVKAVLRDLRGMGMNARHAWVGLGFDGVQVDLAGVPSREWYDADGSLVGHALPLACPLDLAKYVVETAERQGLTAVSCPFYDLGLVYVVAAGDAAEASRVRDRWAAEVAALPQALWGVSVEEAFRRERQAVAS